MSTFTPSIFPPGSLILVTAANSYIGAHVVDMLLDLGYKVRGAVRSLAKGRWLQDRFDKCYEKGAFSLVVVEDMAADGAYQAAIKGVVGVVHVASPTQSTSGPQKVISAAEKGVLEVLDSALFETGIKRVVLTSSSVAVVEPSRAQDVVVTHDMWNNDAVKEAWALSLDFPSKALAVYTASKVKSEQAMWNWVAKHQPSFTVNSVIPSFVLGKPLDPIHQGHTSSSGVPVTVYNNDRAAMAAFIDKFPPFFFVDVQDVARLHIAALLPGDVKAERIFAFGDSFNRNDIVQSLCRLFPKRQFADDIPNPGRNESIIVPSARARDLLRRGWNKDFTDLHDSLRSNMEEFL